LLKVLQLGGELLAPGLQFTQADDLCLIRIQQTLVLALQSLLALEQLALACGEGRQSMWFGLDPSLM
jgi:hypothetical protein